MSSEWNRPRLQRQEIGPMLHDFGHQVYDRAEVSVLDEIAREQTPAPTSFDDLARLVDMTTGHLRTAQHSLLDANLDSAVREVNFTSGDLNKPVLTIGLESTLEEGFVSGVLMPLQLYRLMRIKETCPADMIDLGRYVDLPAVDAAELIDRLSQDNFQQMLQQLAIGKNGSLGSTSTKLHALVSPNLGDGPNFLMEVGYRRLFILSDDGKVSGFTSAVLEEQKQAKAFSRKHHIRSEESGGCPVRHASFPVVGEVATKYLVGVGREDGQPHNQGESLVLRGNRFLYTLLQATLEQTEAVA